MLKILIVMTDTEITALAREYAEEKGKKMEHEQILPNCLIKEVMKMDTEEQTKFMTWLTRRFCLVEKSDLEKTRQVIMNIIKAGENLRRKKSIDEGKAQLSLFDALFPEIAKEVR